jgi:hypothetical protein
MTQALYAHMNNKIKKKSMMLAIGLSYIAFLMLRYIPMLLRVIIMKWC